MQYVPCSYIEGKKEMRVRVNMETIIIMTAPSFETHRAQKFLSEATEYFFRRIIAH